MTFEEILQEFNIEIAPEGHHHTHNGWLNFDCPWCGKDTHKYHMGYSIAGNYTSCWRCGSHSVVDTLCQLAEITQHEARELLKDLESDFAEPIRPTGKLVLPYGIKPLSELKPHRKYLRSRGYNWKELEKLWQIQGISLAPKLAWRIFIPITLHGTTVSWTTRAIGNQELRYISASPEEEAISHKSLLYGEDYARHAIVLVEGPFDAWRIGPGAVATLGTGFSQAQVNRAIRFPVRVIVYDSEPEAQKRAKKLLNALIDFPGETINVTLDAKDPGCASDKEIKQIRKLIK